MTSTTKPNPKLQFESFVVFFNLLKALLQHCSSELSRLRLATDLKLLAEHPDLAQYTTVLTDDNFVSRWNKLLEVCFTDQKPKPKFMIEEANIIRTALLNCCDLLTKFNDFPAPPSKNLVDMKRYNAELSALIVRNKNVYNGIQKWFIDRCILTTRFTIAALDLQNHCKGDCYNLKWRSLASTLKCSNSPNFQIKPTDVTDYMMSASPGHCKCESQASSHGKSRKPESSVKDQSTETDSPVPETTKVEQYPQGFQLAHTVNITYNIAGSMAPETVNDEMQRIEKVHSPASLPSPGVKRAVTCATNSASEPSPKRPCQTPAPEINEPTKLGKYATFKQFLEDLLIKFSCELSGFKTPSEMKVFLANQPAMKPFQEIFMNKNFVTQWKELRGKCDPIPTAPSTMETAAREIAIGLAMKGSLIKHFADFPAKPQGNNVEDLERCIGEIKIMLKKQPEYDFSQMKYLTNLQLTLQRKLTRLHNLLDVIQPRSGKSEHAAPSETVTLPQRFCATSVAPVHDSLGSKSAKKSPIDCFVEENPNVPEKDKFREFSYLDPETRNRYVKMAEEASGNVY